MAHPDSFRVSIKSLADQKSCTCRIQIQEVLGASAFQWFWWICEVSLHFPASAKDWPPFCFDRKIAAERGISSEQSTFNDVALWLLWICGILMFHCVVLRFLLQLKLIVLDRDNLVLSHKKRNVQSYTIENTADILPNLPRTQSGISVALMDLGGWLNFSSFCRKNLEVPGIISLRLLPKSLDDPLLTKKVKSQGTPKTGWLFYLTWAKWRGFPCAVSQISSHTHPNHG